MGAGVHLGGTGQVGRGAQRMAGGLVFVSCCRSVGFVTAWDSGDGAEWRGLMLSPRLPACLPDRAAVGPFVRAHLEHSPPGGPSRPPPVGPERPDLGLP